MADREPIVGAGRPSDEMPPLPSPQTTPHSSHDLVLLAAAVDRDAKPSLKAAATEQAAACTECAALAADLRSLAGGLAALPASRPVPRDMRITAEQAARLGRGGLWRRLLRPFGADGAPLLRPLAATLTTLGLVGVLLTAIPFGFPAGGAAILSTVGSAVGSPGGGSYSGGQVPEVAASPGGQGTDAKGLSPYPPVPAASQVPGAAGGPVDNSTDRGTGTPSFAALADLPQLPPLTWLSLALVVVGLGLFGIRLLARRLG